MLIVWGHRRWSGSSRHGVLKIISEIAATPRHDAEPLPRPPCQLPSRHGILELAAVVLCLHLRRSLCHAFAA